MRPIDADETLDYLVARQKKAIKEDGERYGMFFDIGIFALANAPTINVIPIEWLDSYCTDCSICLRDNDEKAIKKLLEDWKKENESDKTR